MVSPSFVSEHKACAKHAKRQADTRPQDNGLKLQHTATGTPRVRLHVDAAGALPWVSRKTVLVVLPLSELHMVAARCFPQPT